MFASDFLNVSPQGIVLQNLPVLNVHAGNIFWVDSGAGSNGNKGTFQRPFATIDYAIGRCTASNGDMIMVKPDHVETVSVVDGIDFDVAGVTVIGIGHGSNRPTITMSTTASTVHIDAVDIYIGNLLFLPIAAVNVAITISKTDFTMESCEFRGAASTNQFINAIGIDGGSNACDRMRILGCKFTSPTANAASVITLNEVTDNVEITNCYMTGDYEVAAFRNTPDDILTNLLIRYSIITNERPGELAVEMLSASTGMLIRNMYNTDSAAAASINPGACQSFECYGNDNDTTANAVLSPAIT